jgi:hypothetical protein
VPEGLFHGVDTTEVVAAQLGRRPAIEFEVAVVCPYSWPAVLSNSPLNPAGEPNPNLYYLSCPYLQKELSRLEDSGEITKLQELLARDRRMQESLGDAQRRHKRLWQSLVTGNPAAKGYKAPAIAGVGNDLQIKCLHAHYAFYLARGGYLVGDSIAGALPERWCGDNRCLRLVEGLKPERG